MGHGAKPGERRGGRAKGTLNKQTKELVEILREKNYDPVAELIEVGAIAKKEWERADEIFDAIQEARIEKKLIPLSESTAPTYLKIMQSSASDIMQYVYPKRKATELTGKDGKDLMVTFADVMKASAEAERKRGK